MGLRELFLLVFLHLGLVHLGQAAYPVAPKSLHADLVSYSAAKFSFVSDGRLNHNIEYRDIKNGSPWITFTHDSKEQFKVLSPRGMPKALMQCFLIGLAPSTAYAMQLHAKNSEGVATAYLTFNTTAKPVVTGRPTSRCTGANITTLVSIERDPKAHPFRVLTSENTQDDKYFRVGVNILARLQSGVPVQIAAGEYKPMCIDNKCTKNSPTNYSTVLTTRLNKRQLRYIDKYDFFGRVVFFSDWLDRQEIVQSDILYPSVCAAMASTSGQISRMAVPTSTNILFVASLITGSLFIHSGCPVLHARSLLRST